MSALRGAEVLSADGSAVGRIEDLLFDVASGRVEYALVARGGRDKFLPVPRGRMRDEDGRFVLDVGEQALADAPELDRDDLQRLADERVRADIDARFRPATPGL